MLRTQRGLRTAVKRGIDILGACIGLSLATLPIALAVVAIRATSPGPVFFRQERVGKGAKPFRVIKLRTMILDAESHRLGAFTTREDPRITTAGRWARRWGIDELPQFINILRGEMSLVGPRPSLPYQAAKYDDDQKRRFLVKPGLTGWALIHGRNSLTWPEKLAFDTWYAEHWTLRLDLAILLKTFPMVFSGRGLFLEKEDEILRQ